ncbi:MAG: septal ring lytic transglycosylase RlpA family protein [Bacteroidota bacterium]
MRLIQITVALLLTLSLGFSVMVEEYGVASFYDDSFQGRKTASGQLYNKNRLTAAHKTHEFGTILKVTRLDNKKSVKVKVNDRGPYIKGRIVDLSRKAAEALDLVKEGTAKVKVEVVGKGSLEEETAAVEPTPAPAAAAPAPTQPKEDPKPTGYGTEIAKPANSTPPVAERVKKTNVNPSSSTTPKAKTATPVKSTPVQPAKPAPAPAKPAASKESMVKGRDFKQYDLYKVQLLRPTREGFGVQIESLTQYESVMKRVAELQEKWFKNVLISVEKGKDNKPNYKIILGPFPDRTTAESYKKQLKKKKKIKGFVVDLSSIEYDDK